MPDMLSLPVRDFVAATAAKHPTPGGGSVGALCGALAAALAAMAVEFTIGKKKFLPYDDELKAALERFHTATAMFEEIIEEDIAAYEGLSPLLKLLDPKSDPNYVTAVVAALRAPQTAAGFAFNVLEQCAGLLDKTTKFLVSDLASAAALAHAVVHVSQLNVLVNVPLLPNPEEGAALRQSIAELVQKADRVYADFRVQFLQRL